MSELMFVGGVGDRDWVGDGKDYSRNFPQGNRVYSSQGISCTQTSQGGGLGSFTGLYLISEGQGENCMKENKRCDYTGQKIKVFEAFSGYGSQRMALRNLGVDFESVGISEIDIPAILSYASIHDGLNIEDETFEYPSKEEMIAFLESKNIGLDFKTKKIKLPKNLNKLKQIYRATVLSNCYGDISLLTPNELPDMDLFTYSFPCTDISVAGQQQGVIKGQTRSGLLYECEKVIETKRPKYLLMENVKNLVGKKFKAQFDEWLEYLESLGYINYWQVLNAKDYGVPQNRERVFVVSILGDEDKDYVFPQKQQLNIRLKDILESQVEDKYYLSDEVQARFKPNDKFKEMSANIVGTTAPDFRTIGQRDLCYQENAIMGALVATDYKQPKQIVELNKNKQNAISIIKQLENTEQLQEDVTTCDMSVNNPKAKDIANCITARYDCGVSNNKSVGVAVVERIGGCFDDENSTHQAGSVYNQDGLSPTLDTMQGGYRQPCITTVGKNITSKFLQEQINYRIRKLTPKECWRLMGCSDEDFYKAKQFNSDSQLYKQAGNSIVVDVLEGIFYQLFKEELSK